MEKFFSEYQRWVAKKAGRRSLAFYLSLLAIVGSSSCGFIDASITNLETSAPVLDFKKTEIISSTSVPADGSSEMNILIHLKNDDSTPVPNYKPTYEIVTGAGVNASECTTSDIHGVSACILKSTLPGFKKLRLTNALVGLEREVQFIRSVRSGNFLGIASAANGVKSQSTNGSIVEMSLGEMKGLKSTTAGHHKVFLSGRGNTVSR